MNAEYDGLVEKYLSTIPIPERLEVGRAIVRHISEELPAMGLFYSVQPMLVSSRAVTWRPRPIRACPRVGSP